MQLLLVEDDRPLLEFLRKAFREEGYATDTAADGNEALERALARAYDCIVLDLMLPGRDGLSVVEELRKRAVNSPVLMLTARSELDLRVRGLETGADDYLAKPFDLAELIARVHALIRRSRMRHEDTQLSCGDLSLDPIQRRVMCRDRRVDLSARELALLEFLMRNAGRTVSRSRIAEAVWNHQFDTDTNVVDVYINYLRKKLTFRGVAPPIKTVRGVGYRLDEE
jgi:two-component system, OmpR family, response regulator